jgi:hypothetical protein
VLVKPVVLVAVEVRTAVLAALETHQIHHHHKEVMAELVPLILLAVVVAVHLLLALLVL